MGGAVSPTTCGINQTEDSAVAFFNGTGERFIETRRLDLTSALYWTKYYYHFPLT
jgi:hypothetical protein